jgi:hypothetical protein
MDATGKPLHLEGKIVKQQGDHWWVNVGPIALLVDEEIVHAKEVRGDQRQVGKEDATQTSEGPSGKDIQQPA